MGNIAMELMMENNVMVNLKMENKKLKIMIFLKTNQNQKQQKNKIIVNSLSKTRILKVNKNNNKMVKI